MAASGLTSSYILSSRPLSICLKVCRMPFFLPPPLPWRCVRIFLNNKTRHGRERSVRQLPSDSFANKTTLADQHKRNFPESTECWPEQDGETEIWYLAQSLQKKQHLWLCAKILAPVYNPCLIDGHSLHWPEGCQKFCAHTICYNIMLCFASWSFLIISTSK